MRQFSDEQRTWVCLEMARVQNANEVIRRWRNRWAPARPPCKSAIYKMYDKLKTHSTCRNRNKEGSGRPRTARSEENLERVKAALDEDGNRSSRRNGLGLARSSFLRVIKEIKYHPYILITQQKLEPTDPELRLAFCRRFIETVHQNGDFLDNLIVSDEAIFSLNSEVTTKNVVKYAEHGHGQPPGHFVQFKQGAGQIMAWVGFTSTGKIFGPHFIEGRLDTREYMRIIRYHVIQQDFRDQNVNRQQTWWQQDGAPAHTSNISMRYLRGQFPGKLISKRGDWPWPPRSPDLTPCDFFLWGYVKNKIWTVDQDQQPQNIPELRAAITREITNIPNYMLRNVFNGMVTRCEACIEKGGYWLDNE